MSGGYGYPGPLRVSVLDETGFPVAAHMVLDNNDQVHLYVMAGRKPLSWQVFDATGRMLGSGPVYGPELPHGGMLHLTVSIPMLQVNAVPVLVPHIPVPIPDPVPPPPPTVSERPAGPVPEQSDPIRVSPPAQVERGVS